MLRGNGLLSDVIEPGVESDREAIIESGMQFGTCYRLAHLLARSFNTVQGSARCNINRDDI